MHRSRRQFLRLAASFLGMSAIAGCGATPTATPVPTKPPAAAATTAPAPAPTATKAPAPTAAPAVPTAAPAATKAPAAPTAAPSSSASLDSYPMNKNVKGTVRFWHAWGGARTALVETMINEFQAVYPNVKIEPTILVTGRLEKFLTSIAGGDPPDVGMTMSSDLPAFAQDGAIESLEQYVQRDKLDVDKLFYASEINARRFEGKLYLLPHVTAAARDLLFFKKTVFADAGLDPTVAPKNWADLGTLADKIIKKSGTEVTRYPMPIDVNTDPLFITWLYLNGGLYVSDDQKQIKFQEAAGVETIEWMSEWTKKYVGDYSKLRPGTSAGADIAEAYRKLYAADKIGMYIGGNFMLFQFVDYKVKTEDYVVHLVPPSGKAGTKFGSPTPGGHGLFIPKGAKNLDAAWEWIKWACMSESYYKFILAQMRPSPLKAVNEKPELAKSSPYWPVVVKALETDVSIPVSPAWPKINTEFLNMQDAVMYGKKTPKDALAEAAKMSQQYLDEWNAKRKR